MDSDKEKKFWKLEALAKQMENGDPEETVRVEETMNKAMEGWSVPIQIQLTNTDEPNFNEKDFDQEKQKNVEDFICWDNCDFETAISATGYGRYNLKLMAGTVFPMLSCLAASSTMSFILPSAECDLQLSNFHKGILNASTYIGMICSAFVWGFLSDTLGRQKLIMVGFALDALLHLTAALSQTFQVLLAAKLLAGFICSGPFAILMTYLAECHSAEHRASIIQWTGVFSAIGTVILPLLAWAVIPQPWSLTLFGGSLYLPSWRIFLLICTIPGIVSSITFYFLKESPKFLMTHGRQEEAMQVFQFIYATNKQQPKSTYPVRSLLEEKTEKKDADGLEANKSCLHLMNLGWMQVKPLFKTPHLSHALLIFAFQGGTLFGLNTIRLWMPQLFSSILANEHMSANASSVCELLTTPQEDSIKDCSEHLVDGQVYINSIIIGIVTAISYLLSGYLIKALGKKWLIIGCTIPAVVICFSMYWATSINLMLSLSALFVSLTSVTSTAILSIAVDLFPTSLRSMAVSLTMMFGRLGAMAGNLMFPVLLDWDCTVPFFLMAAVVGGSGLLVALLPKTKGKSLE